MNLKEYALYYAEMGLAVFPLRPGSKKPATATGFKEATTNKDQIEKWWTKCPDYNIGIATGDMSGGLVVIDLDRNEEKGYDGYEVLKEWQKKNGNLPETAISITGRGGYHYFYRDPEKSWKTKVGLYEGIDIRADGGYIVAPPSLHPNGRRYEWEQGPEEYGFTPVNMSVSASLKPEEYTAEKHFCSPEVIPLHTRADTLMRLACSQQAKGLSDEAIRAAVKAENQAKCVPPMTDEELEEDVFRVLKRYEKGTAPYENDKNLVVCDKGKARPVKQRKKIQYTTAKELVAADLPPVEYIVDIIVSKGLVILSAKSKIGKSWFALDLAIAVSSGADFLGFNTTQGDVLYIDLENTKALTQQRLTTLLNGAEPPEGLTIANDYSTMNDTFLEDITEYLEQHPKVSLVIVDVFQKIKKSKSNNKADYDDVYENFTPLKELAEKYKISLILVTHDRKMTDPTDPFANILGSTAIMGASDEVIVIHKKNRKDVEATLSITGRTVRECEYAIKFNHPICKWEMIGDAAEIQEQREKEEFYNNPLVKTIVKLVDQGKGEYTGKVSEIISASTYFRTRIYKNAKQTGRELRKIIPLLKKYYGIEHYAPNKGTASPPHTFRRLV